MSGAPISEQAVASLRSRYPNENIDKALAWVEKCAAKGDVNSPEAMLEAIVKRSALKAGSAPHVPTAAARPGVIGAAEPEFKYLGFTKDGVAIRSSVPIRNATTDDTIKLAFTIRTDCLAPSEALMLARGLHETVQWALAASAQGWLRAEQLCEESGFVPFTAWPICIGTNSLSEFCRSMAGSYPWARDENLWTTMTAKAISRHESLSAPED